MITLASVTQTTHIQEQEGMNVVNNEVPLCTYSLFWSSRFFGRRAASSLFPAGHNIRVVNSVFSNMIAVHSPNSYSRDKEKLNLRARRDLDVLVTRIQDLHRASLAILPERTDFEPSRSESSVFLVLRGDPVRGKF